jgi:hypothetical protein
MAIPSRSKGKSIHEEMKLLTQYQIKKYAEKEGLQDIHDLFAEIQDLTKKVREELYRLLVVEFRYFE